MKFINISSLYLIKTYYFIFVLLLGFGLNAASDDETNCAIPIADQTALETDESYTNWALDITKNSLKLTDTKDVQFLYNLINPIEIIEKLDIHASEIETVLETISTAGAFAPMVVKVRVKNQGIKVLKIYDYDSISIIENFRNSIVIQNALAESGFAPKVTGLLSESEMSLLRTNFPHLEFGNKDLQKNLPSFGMLMDFVQKGSFTSYAPSLEKQVKDLENELSRLRILPYDLEYLINSSGILQLIDIDLFSYISRDGKINHELYTDQESITILDFLELLDYPSRIEFQGFNNTNHFIILEDGTYLVKLSELRAELGLKP